MNVKKRDYLIVHFEGQKAQIGEFMGETHLLVKNEKVDKDLISTFRNFKINDASDETTSWVVVYTDEKKILYTLANAINSYDDISLIEIFHMFGKAFEISREKFLKFRGDFAELIFIKKRGGEKIFDGASADINFDGQMVEIKSFSPQKRIIKISYQQLIENTNKFAIPMLIDNHGMNIIELANSIEGNSSFKQYIDEKYSMSPLLKIKYQIAEPISLEEKLVKFILPNAYISATLELRID